MVRASRVTNPLSRALGAGVVIGGMTAALFLMTETGTSKPTYAGTAPVMVKTLPTS